MIESRESIAAPIVTWCGISLFSILITACNIPLWPTDGAAGLRFALAKFVVFEIAASSLLFPWLMRNTRVGAAIVLLCIPLAQLVGWIADESRINVMYLTGLLEVWLTSLWLWSKVVDRKQVHLQAVALAGLIGIGGMVLMYLRMEFGEFSGDFDGKLIGCILALILFSSVIGPRLLGHR